MNPSRTQLQLIILMLLASSSVLFSQVPQKMTYQSVVRNASNALVANAPVGVQISILQGSSTGIASYIERHTPNTNANGLATFEIGSGTVVAGSFATINWANGPYFIKTETDPSGGTVYSISTTSQLVSVPYALYAANSGSSLPGPQGPAGPQGPQGPQGPAGTGGVTLDQAYDFGGAGAGRIITADAGSVTINASGSGNAGIGLLVNQTGSNTAAIGASLSGTGNAINVTSTNASNTFATIQAITNSATLNNSAVFGQSSGQARAVTGEATAASTTDVAVRGFNQRTNGGIGVEGEGFNGVSGFTIRNNGFAVFGENTGTPNVATGTNNAVGVAGVGGIGVNGQTINGQLAGMLGQNLNTGITYNNIGVYGQSETGAGVWGENIDGSYYGVFSNGDLGSSGAKTFLIDHPSDPTNKYLRHFSLESDEVLNYYRGIIMLNSNGEAQVQLPSYFHLVNGTMFNYQLTSIGVSSPGLFVSEEINNGTFKIAGGQPGQKVSWTITAERNDPYMQHHPEKRQVEVEKREGDKGKYLMPGLYGKLPNSGTRVHVPELKKVK